MLLVVVGGSLLLGCGKSQQGRVPQPGQRGRSGWCGKRSNLGLQNQDFDLSRSDPP